MGGGSMDLPTAKAGPTTVVLLGDLLKSGRLLSINDVKLAADYLEAYRRAYNGEGIEFVVNYLIGAHISEEEAREQWARALESSVLSAFNTRSDSDRQSLTNNEKGLIAENICRRIICRDVALKREMANRYVEKLYVVLGEGNSIGIPEGVLQMTNGEIVLREVVDNVQRDIV